MLHTPRSSPNPKRVEAGRRNRSLRGALTPQGCERLRQAAILNRPWQRSTGPKTAAGKARSAANGRLRQKGDKSIRQIRGSVADACRLIDQMAAYRRLAMAGCQGIEQ